MFRNINDKYPRMAGYTLMNNYWTVDKPMAAFTTCHLGLLLTIAILLNLYGTAPFEQLLNSARLIEMWL